jgi:hypothetical protein
MLHTLKLVLLACVLCFAVAPAHGKTAKTSTTAASPSTDLTAKSTSTTTGTTATTTDTTSTKKTKTAKTSAKTITPKKTEKKTKRAHVRKSVQKKISKHNKKHSKKNSKKQNKKQAKAKPITKKHHHHHSNKKHAEVAERHKKFRKQDPAKPRFISENDEKFDIKKESDHLFRKSSLKEVTAKFEKKMVIPLATSAGNTKVKLLKLKEDTHQAFVGGKDSVQVIVGNKLAPVAFKQAEAAISKAETLAQQLAAAEIKKTESGKKKSIGQEINDMLSSMFEKLFGENEKIQQMSLAMKVKREQNKPQIKKDVLKPIEQKTLPSVLKARTSSLGQTTYNKLFSKAEMKPVKKTYRKVKKDQKKKDKKNH